jgi:hypothetical protein
VSLTATVRGHLQGRIVAAIQAANPGLPKCEIAKAAGVHKSDVSRWCNDDGESEREIGFDEIVQMIRVYGAVPVLEALADLKNCDVIARDATGGESTGALSGRMVWLLGQLVALHGEATSPESEGGEQITDAELLKYRPALLKALPVLRGLLALAERAAAMPLRRPA